jgi:hypothetical protein
MEPELGVLAGLFSPLQVTLFPVKTNTHLFVPNVIQAAESCPKITVHSDGDIISCDSAIDLSETESDHMIRHVTVRRVRSFSDLSAVKRQKGFQVTFLEELRREKVRHLCSFTCLVMVSIP